MITSWPPRNWGAMDRLGLEVEKFSDDEINESLHELILPDDQHPVAIVLHFVDPVRSRRDLSAGCRQAELVRQTHDPKIRFSIPFTRGTSGNPASY